MPVVAVYDTNVLFSGTAGWKGLPYQCVEAARSGAVELFLCVEILQELEDKLQKKLNFSPERAANIVADILTAAKLVPITGELKAVRMDPSDDMLVECAVVARAAYLVTGDHRHLLPLKEVHGIRIVTCAEFLAIIQRR